MLPAASGQALGEGAEPGVGLRGCGQGVGLRWVEPGVGGGAQRGGAQQRASLEWRVLGSGGSCLALPPLPSGPRTHALELRGPGLWLWSALATSVSAPCHSVTHVAARLPFAPRLTAAPPSLTLSHSLLGLAVLGPGVGKAAEPGVEGGCRTGASPPWAGWGPHWSGHQLSWPGAPGAPASAPSSSGSRTELAGQECPVWGGGCWERLTPRGGLGTGPGDGLGSQTGLPRPRAP